MIIVKIKVIDTWVKIIAQIELFFFLLENTKVLNQYVRRNKEKRIRIRSGKTRFVRNR